jgi:hypothetical protein
MSGPLLVVVGVVAALSAGLILLKMNASAALNAVATGAEMARTKAVVLGDSLGKVQDWADKALGGHLVVKKGELEWVPRFTVSTPDVSALSDWVNKLGALEREKMAIEQATTLLEYTKTSARVALENAKNAESAVMFLELGMARQRTIITQEQRDRLAGYKETAASQRALYATLTGEVTKYQDNLNGISAKFRPIIIKAEIKDMKIGIEAAQKELQKLSGKPHTLELLLKEAGLNDKIKRLKAAIADVTSKNKDILLTLNAQQLEQR